MACCSRKPTIRPHPVAVVVLAFFVAPVTARAVTPEQLAKLTFRHGGRDNRLTDVHGEVIEAILA